jgi:predicted house-cleaning NTP pyrophosphatase (Maf/HAM1 superfamily)
MPLNLPVLEELNKKSIVLASASPRRREILESIVRRPKYYTTTKRSSNFNAASIIGLKIRGCHYTKRRCK